MALIRSSGSANSGSVPASHIFDVDPDSFLIERTRETDRDIRSADVFLYTRPVGSHGRNGEIDQSHWGLVFKFEDFSVRYLEGNELNNMLRGYYYKFPPPTSVGEKFLGLATINTSPEIVRDAGVRNKSNYSLYCFSTNNCQNWVKNFAQEFGNDFLIHQMEKYNTLEESKPVFAHLASKSVGAYKFSQTASEKIADGSRAFYKSFSRLSVSSEEEKED